MANNPAAWEVLTGCEGATEDDMLNGARHFHALKGASLLPPENVADAVLFLNSDLAGSVTGVTLPVDAGHILLTGHNHAPVK